MTPDDKTKLREWFNVETWRTVDEILAKIDEVVAEERGHEFFAGYDKGKIAGAAIERTSLIKVVEGMRIEKHWRDLEPHEYYNEALDAVLAHLRTGEEVTDEQLDHLAVSITETAQVFTPTIHSKRETEKGGSSFSGRVNFGKPRLSNPVRPWPKEISPQPQDSIREGCCEKCLGHWKFFDEFCRRKDCECHSPREEGFKIGVTCRPAPTEEKPNQ